MATLRRHCRPEQAIQRAVFDHIAARLEAKKRFGIDPKVLLTIFPLDAAASNRRTPNA